MIVKAGTLLTIDGSNFGTEACHMDVKLGEASCAIASASDSQVTCTLDNQEGLVALNPTGLKVTVNNR